MLLLLVQRWVGYLDFPQPTPFFIAIFTIPAVMVDDLGDVVVVKFRES